MRAARRRTCAPDSSPDMYSTRRPALATRAATCSNRVDLPTPGSPAMSIIEPGTMPPPSRRSTSAMPVVARSAATSGCALRGAGSSGASPTGRLSVRGGVLVLGSRNSAYVPHAPQPGQRPSHLGLVRPHSEQRNVVLVLALGGTRESSPTRDNNATGGWRGFRVRRAALPSSSRRVGAMPPRATPETWPVGQSGPSPARAGMTEKTARWGSAPADRGPLCIVGLVEVEGVVRWR